MPEMRKWFLAGVLAACVCALAGCAKPEPPAPPKPQLMNGFYIDKTPALRPPRPKPTDTTTVAQPVASPAAEPVSEPAPAVQPAVAPSPVAAPPAPPMAVPNDASQFIEPPSR